LPAVVGFNHLFIGPDPLTGPGYYAVQVLENLLRLPADRLASWDLRVVIREGTEHHYSATALARACKVPGLSRQITRVLWEQTSLPRLARRQGFDLLFSPGFVSPLWGAPVLVATIHDMYYRIIPETLPQFQRLYWRAFIPATSRVCDAILAVSQNTGRDLEKFVPAAAGKVTVTPLASRFSPATHSDVIGRVPAYPPYILMIANLTPNKNVGKVVEALAMLRQRGRSIELIHIGTDLIGELKSATQRYAMKDCVRSLGKVSDEELVRVAGGCLALVVPSLYEGFGLPALEALALGAPLICSDRGALPEVAGDAAIIVDPTEAAQIADAVALVQDDGELRLRLQLAGLKRATLFSWAQTAQKTLEVFARQLAAKGFNFERPPLSSG
jgi:glycosyltransferase involved in cell wall biosynthesis